MGHFPEFIAEMSIETVQLGQPNGQQPATSEPASTQSSIDHPVPHSRNQLQSRIIVPPCSVRLLVVMELQAFGAGPA